MSLTPSEITTIKATVPVLATHGTSITTRFYATLLHDTPSLKSVFNTANQANGHQQKALAGALYAYASHIEDPSVLAPTLELIANKHASLGITPAQYELVGTYLLATMKDVLGEACTEEVLGAWEKAYWVLADVLIGRERQLYQQAKAWEGWRGFRIQRKVRESEEITSFYLVPVDEQELPLFHPGQYVSVQVERNGIVQARQYSLSDAPGQKWLRISVKRDEGVDVLEEQAKVRHPGYVSNVLHDEKNEGDELLVSHPYGEFFFDDNESGVERHGKELENGTNGTTNGINGTNGHVNGGTANGAAVLSGISPIASHPAPLILLSAGVGLTPLLSILSSQLSTVSTRPITFIHTARRTAARAFHSELLTLAKKHSQLTVIYFTTHPSDNDIQGRDYDYQGRMDLDLLKGADVSMGVDDSRSKYFVCGPTSFMLGSERKLREWGVGEDRIKLELFGTGGF